MRIAVVAPPWAPVPPAGYGGTEAIIDCLARGYEAAGHEVLLYTTGDSTCPVPKKWLLPEADPARMNWTEVELRHLIHAYEAVKDFDVVHDHTLMGPIFSDRFPDLPVVTTQHHPYSEKFRDIYRVTSKTVPIVAISESQARSAEGMRVAKVIHHGLDPAQISYNDTPGDYFLFLGRMARDKGVHTAARVAREAGVQLKIAARMSDCEGEREYYESEVKPLLGDGVEYLGEVGFDAKIELLRNARALINPIQWDEPFGLVMIEALGSGTPVLALPYGAAPEIVENGVTGFICEDADEMVRRIAEVDSIDRSQCRKSMETYFCMERMVNEYLELFADLIEENRRLLQPDDARQRKVIDLTSAGAEGRSRPSRPEPSVISTTAG